MALSYLVAGAPFVLANLWDVTDKDIDKLSIACMEAVFGSKAEEETENRENAQQQKQKQKLVGAALSDARGACKLKFAVGCAPVMYGLPCQIVGDS